MACNHCSGKSNSSGGSNSSGCGCFGALSCIAGPLTHCPACTGSAQYYQNFPFYTGPCGPALCSGCGCNASSYRRRWGWGGCYGCCNAGVSECASRLNSSSANFTAAAPLMVAAGENVCLTPSAACPDYYYCDEEGIRIRYSGTYMAILTMHVPALQAVSTRMYLTLNGDTLEDSAQDMAASADGTTSTGSASLIFNALPNSLLQLVSSENLSLTGCESANVFRLTLVKL